MAGDGGPGPAQSIEGPAGGSAVPSDSTSDPSDEQPGPPSPAEPGEGPAQTDEGQTESTGATGQDGAPGQAGAPAPDGSPGEDATKQPEAMRQTAFMGVDLELPNVHPSVVLREIDAPMRELRVTIAQPEGVAIAYAWRGIATPRPLTHDLLTTILQRFDVQVDSVRIIGVDGPVFHAELALSGPSGSQMVGCRPSDALALALRQPLPVPIMVAEEVLRTAGHSPGA
ncbi:MAG TPA: bifunctional nuclease domain-containing protein [Acidimicrobiales bacterium]